jgi:hypothetical protein
MGRQNSGKGQKLMKKTLIALAGISLIISNVLLAEEIEKKDLMGVWEVKISPTGVPPPPMLATAMFWQGRQLCRVS